MTNITYNKTTFVEGFLFCGFDSETLIGSGISNSSGVWARDKHTMTEGMAARSERVVMRTFIFAVQVDAGKLKTKI